jgi:GNAT superfamily N-acetyltransferase
VSSPSITYRLATPADLETCASILEVSDDALSASRNMPVFPRNRPALMKLLAHIQERDPDRTWLAEEPGRAIGFGQAVQYEDLTFLAFLFVLPDVQAQGVGRRLMELSMEGSGYRGVCINSIQPISTALYATAGMVPLVPIYIMLGVPQRDLVDLPPGIQMRRMPVHETAPLDRGICGFERAADHEWWQQAGRMLFGLYEDGAALGYGYVQESGRLGPVVVRRPELLAPFVGRLMTSVPPVDAWMVNVPGVASELFTELLRVGLRLEGPPAIFCATEMRMDHRRYLPSSFALP